jgi:hypothetical protein
VLGQFLYISHSTVIRFATVSFVGSSINFKYAIITIVSSVGHLRDIIQYITVYFNEALYYKSEGRRFGSRLGHWIFQ